MRQLQRRYYVSLNRYLKRGYSYPLSARRRRLEGTVMVELLIDEAGQILSTRVLRSSGHESLDQAALAQVNQLGRVPAPPSSLRWRARPIHIPFRYSLRES